METLHELNERRWRFQSHVDVFLIVCVMLGALISLVEHNKLCALTEIHGKTLDCMHDLVVCTKAEHDTFQKKYTSDRLANSTILGGLSKDVNETKKEISEIKAQDYPSKLVVMALTTASVLRTQDRMGNLVGRILTILESYHVTLLEHGKVLQQHEERLCNPPEQKTDKKEVKQQQKQHKRWCRIR